MTATSDLARALEEERKRQGLTVTEIINRASVSRAAVYRLFNGGDVQLTTLLAVTNVLGLDLVPMRAMLAQLVPDAIMAGANHPTLTPPFEPPRRHVLTRGTVDSIQNRNTPRHGPLSAVAARAALLQSKLKTRKS